MPKPKAKPSRHSVEQLSETTWRIVEKDDPYQQYCQCYVRLAPKAKKCFLIDTGCGLGNLREFIEETINTEHWPYTVICTHSHFDHIGSNHLFEGEEICLGAADKKFTLSAMGKPMPLYDGTTMGKVEHFPITRWLQDRELVSLDGASPPNKANSLEVVYCPGHSPDSISLFDPQERRLFSGDFMYPHAAWDDPLSPPGGLYAMSVGSDLSVYYDAMLKMQEYVKEQSDPSLAEITLACGHNTYNMNISFVASALALFEGIRDTKIKCRPVDIFGRSAVEYLHPSDPRCSLVLGSPAAPAVAAD